MNKNSSLFKRIWIGLSFFMALLFALTSCSKKNKTHVPIKEKYFVLGNPYNLVKGSKLNNKMDIPDEIVQQNKYSLLTFQTFSEKTEAIETSDIKKGNESVDITPSEVSEASQPFTIIKSNDSQSYQVTNGVVALSIKKDDTGKTMIYLISEEGDQTHKAELLHVSFTEDYSSLSLLAFEGTKPNRSLLAFYFSPVIQPEDLPKNDSSNFFYILGKSMPMRWDTNQLLEISFCQKNDTNEFSKDSTIFNKYFSLAESAVQNWSSHLVNRLDIKLNVLTNYPPFTDLNTKCIYIVPDYFYSSNKQAFTPGANLSIPNFKSHSFLDSDIFIFDKEEQKILDYLESELGTNISNLSYESIRYINNELDSHRLFAMIHEMGHLLGLGHPFTEHEDDNIYSVMNYNSATSITDYDVQSLQNLYPIRKIPDKNSPVEDPNKPIPWYVELYSNSNNKTTKGLDL